MSKTADNTISLDTDLQLPEELIKSYKELNEAMEETIARIKNKARRPRKKSQK